MATVHFWNWQGDTLILRCQVQARAARDEVIGEHGGRLRIRIQAVPASGAANHRLCRILAGEFGVAPGAVAIGSGSTQRYKSVRISNPAHLPVWLSGRQDEAKRVLPDPVPAAGAAP